MGCDPENDSPEPAGSSGNQESQTTSSRQLKGIDVSDNVGEVDWTQVKAAGYTFAFIKATDGDSYPAEYFQKNWPLMKQAGLIRGAYHFFEPGDDASTQAEFFISTVGTLDGDDLPPVLDLEEAGDLTPAEVTGKVQTWMEKVKNAFGRTPILYCDPSFANQYLTAESLSDYTLWVADYDVDTPEIPTIWKDEGWTFWQYDGDATVAGIPGGKGQTDQDTFIGNEKALRQYIRKSSH